MQKETQTVSGAEERPPAGGGPEPGMQDGGDEEGRGWTEVGTGEGLGAGPARPEVPNSTGPRSEQSRRGVARSLKKQARPRPPSC